MLFVWQTAPVAALSSCIVKEVIWHVMEGGHAARWEVLPLFSDIILAGILRMGRGMEHLWVEAMVWAVDGLSRSATTADVEKHLTMASLYQECSAATNGAVSPNRHDEGGPPPQRGRTVSCLPFSH